MQLPEDVASRKSWAEKVGIRCTLLSPSSPESRAPLLKLPEFYNDVINGGRPERENP
jgi:hypothetical protein